MFFVFINKITEIIHTNITDGNVNVEILSEMLNLSRTQLYRKIKALTNQSAYDFIATIRLKKAAELLLTTNDSVANIAFKVGYTEPGNFARVFAKQYGCTPKEYSNTIREER